MVILYYVTIPIWVFRRPPPPKKKKDREREREKKKAD